MSNPSETSAGQKKRTFDRVRSENEAIMQKRLKADANEPEFIEMDLDENVQSLLALPEAVRHEQVVVVEAGENVFA